MHDLGVGKKICDLSNFVSEQLSTNMKDKLLDTSESQDKSVLCVTTNDKTFVSGLWTGSLASDKTNGNMCKMDCGARATRDLLLEKEDVYFKGVTNSEPVPDKVQPEDYRDHPSILTLFDRGAAMTSC